MKGLLINLRRRQKETILVVTLLFVCLIVLCLVEQIDEALLVVSKDSRPVFLASGVPFLCPMTFRHTRNNVISNTNDIILKTTNLMLTLNINHRLT
jgi:hypothetical protein